MSGFGVDPAALEGAIKKLEGIRDDAQSLVRSISVTGHGAFAGELTAKDTYTTKAFEEINKRAVGQQGSLQIAVKELTDKLGEKIDAYKATLEEYRRTDDAAGSNVSGVQREA
ncbi:hypothetical protein [Saccharopolyspora sp. NPDC002376]